MHDKYFEAIIQLRPATPEVVKYVRDRIKEKKGVFISKEETLKTGIDLYMSSKTLAMSLGKELRKKFKGTTKLSRSIYGINRMSSKKIYRVTICYREKTKTL